MKLSDKEISDKKEKAVYESNTMDYSKPMAELSKRVRPFPLRPSSKLILVYSIL
jgi:hypothetical protein